GAIVVPVVTDEVTRQGGTRDGEAVAARPGVANDVGDVRVADALLERGRVALELVGPRAEHRTPRADQPVPLRVRRLVRPGRGFLHPELRHGAGEGSFAEGGVRG